MPEKSWFSWALDDILNFDEDLLLINDDIDLVLSLLLRKDENKDGLFGDVGLEPIEGSGEDDKGFDERSNNCDALLDNLDDFNVGVVTFDDGVGEFVLLKFVTELVLTLFELLDSKNLHLGVKHSSSATGEYFLAHGLPSLSLLAPVLLLPKLKADERLKIAILPLPLPLLLVFSFWFSFSFDGELAAKAKFMLTLFALFEKNERDLESFDWAGIDWGNWDCAFAEKAEGLAGVSGIQAGEPEIPILESLKDFELLDIKVEGAWKAACKGLADA